MKTYPSTRPNQQGAPAGLNDPRSTGRNPPKPRISAAALPNGQKR